MHAKGDFKKMPLKELEELAYAVQIDYEPPLREADREYVIEELLYLIDNIDNINVDEILERRLNERRKAGIRCGMLYFSDQQLIFYPTKDGSYECYTRAQALSMIVDDELADKEKFLLTELLNEKKYPNISVEPFTDEIEYRLGKYRHDREHTYENGQTKSMAKLKDGKTEYVRFYENDMPYTFYIQ